MRKYIPIVFIAILLMIQVIPAFWTSTIPWQSIAHVGLSGPVILAVLVGTLVALYEEPLRRFLDELSEAEAPGVKLKRKAEQQSDHGQVPVDEVHRLLSEQESQLQTVLTAEREAAAAAAFDLEKQVQWLASERFRWRAEFALRYLVPNSQLVLAWIAGGTIVKRAVYDTTWAPQIPDPKERESILAALAYVEFVVLRQDEDEIEITPDGRFFSDVFVLPKIQQQSA